MAALWRAIGKLMHLGEREKGKEDGILLLLNKAKKIYIKNLILNVTSWKIKQKAHSLKFLSL